MLFDKYFSVGLTDDELDSVINCAGFTDDDFTKFDGKYLHDLYFNHIIKNGYQILIYEFFYKLIELISLKVYLPIFSFYDELSLEQKYDFFKIPSKCNFNPYITKIFTKFIYEVVKYIKSSSTPTDSELLGKGKSNKPELSNLFIEDTTIIKEIINCIKNINEVYKTNEDTNTTVYWEDDYAYQDILNNCISTIIELVTISHGKTLLTFRCKENESR